MKKLAQNFDFKLWATFLSSWIVFSIFCGFAVGIIGGIECGFVLAILSTFILSKITGLEIFKGSGL